MGDRFVAQVPPEFIRRLFTMKATRPILRRLHNGANASGSDARLCPRAASEGMPEKNELGLIKCFGKVLSWRNQEAAMTTAEENAKAVCHRSTLETHRLYVEHVVPRLKHIAEELSRPDLGPAGYDMMFGPPIVGAEILFIGYQPGGTVEEGKGLQPAERQPAWPSQCAYAVADWKLARVLQGIFTAPFLLKCTGSERQFFRAADDRIYSMWPADLRRATEEFSLRHLRDLVEALAPKRIVFIGLKAMRTTVTNYEILENRERGGCLLGRATFAGVPALGCIHLSGGARLTNGEMARISKALRAFANIGDGKMELPTGAIEA